LPVQMFVDMVLSVPIDDDDDKIRLGDERDLHLLFLLLQFFVLLLQLLVPLHKLLVLLLRVLDVCLCLTPDHVKATGDEVSDPSTFSPRNLTSRPSCAKRAARASSAAEGLLASVFSGSLRANCWAVGVLTGGLSKDVSWSIAMHDGRHTGRRRSTLRYFPARGTMYN
jgi:hypothetical protein